MANDTMEGRLLGMLEEKEKQLQEKENQLRHKDHLLEEKDKQIEEKLKEKDKELKEKDLELKRLSQKLDVLLMDSNYIEMREYTKKRKALQRWLSPPYYLYGGYKMCFEVDLRNSEEEGRFLIDHHLLKGPFDDSLKWPFTGKVVLRVIDQTGNNKHHDYEYDYNKAGNEGNRVTEESETGMSVWFGATSRQLSMSAIIGEDEYRANDTIQFLVLSL